MTEPQLRILEAITLEAINEALDHIHSDHGELRNYYIKHRRQAIQVLRQLRFEIDKSSGHPNKYWGLIVPNSVALNRFLQSQKQEIAA